MNHNIKDKGVTTDERSLSSQTPSLLEKPSSSSDHDKKSWSFFRRKSSAEKEAKRKEKRESMSDSGAFRVEMRNGVPITVENRNWPPGVDYKESSMAKQLRSVNGGMGDFYENKGAIAPGGETAGNVGPDPDWVPGLSEEERKKLRDDKSGRYGKSSPQVKHNSDGTLLLLTCNCTVF